jgi:hypothetical protein
MAVVVKFHGVGAPSIEAWRRWMLAQPPHDPGMFQVMKDAMTQRLEQTNGLPQGAVVRADLVPRRYIWRFTSNAWIHFVRKKKDGGRIIEVVVIEVSDRPPP